MEQSSSSSRTNPIELKDCIEELLKFTLESYINNTLEFELGLPKDFCFNLLSHNSNQYTSDSCDQGASGPLYKHLASVLYECTVSGALPGRSKESEWDKLMLDKGTELVNMLNAINFDLDVQEPYFTQLKDGLKTVEGRCAKGAYNRIGSGALILFNKTLLLDVQDVHRYASFSEMLETETLAKVLPGVKTIDAGVKVYRKFYTEEEERLNGVLALCVAKSASQPYMTLATILSELGDKGLENFLSLLNLSEATPDAR